jgi:hypothetical protein
LVVSFSRESDILFASISRGSIVVFRPAITFEVTTITELAIVSFPATEFAFAVHHLRLHLFISRDGDVRPG